MKKEEPIRGQKEFIGLLDFPQTFKEKVHEICKQNNRNETASNIKLNKLEDFLLKLVIPFIRIGHMPRGPYFKVKGDLIMISSDVRDTMNKILPISQDLIPISFKRKLSYKGHYIEEYIDKKKVMLYFEFLKKYNHLYEEVDFDESILNKFESELLQAINATEEEDEDENDSDTEDDDLIQDKFSSASLITDKYKEDSSAHTVANKMADMILKLEVTQNSDDSTNIHEPEDEIYLEDENYNDRTSESEEDCSLDEDEIELEDADLENFMTYKNLKAEVLKLCRLKYSKHCKCTLTKIIASIIR